MLDFLSALLKFTWKLGQKPYTEDALFFAVLGLIFVGVSMGFLLVQTLGEWGKGKESEAIREHRI